MHKLIQYKFLLIKKKKHRSQKINLILTLYILNFTAISFSLYFCITGKALITFNCDNESFKGNFTSLFKGLSQSENHFMGTFISRFTNRKAINLMNCSETAKKC